MALFALSKYSPVKKIILYTPLGTSTSSAFRPCIRSGHRPSLFVEPVARMWNCELSGDRASSWTRTLAAGLPRVESRTWHVIGDFDILLGRQGLDGDGNGERRWSRRKNKVGREKEQEAQATRGRYRILGNLASSALAEIILAFGGERDFVLLFGASSSLKQTQHLLPFTFWHRLLFKIEAQK